MKLINNMLGQIATVATAEALMFGKKAGLDPRKIFKSVSVSGTACSSRTECRACRRVISYPAAQSKISYKDQELETSYAKALGMPLLMANLSQQIYQMARTAGPRRKARRSSRCSSAWRG